MVGTCDLYIETCFHLCHEHQSDTWSNARCSHGTFRNPSARLLSRPGPPSAGILLFWLLFDLLNVILLSRAVRYYWSWRTLPQPLFSFQPPLAEFFSELVLQGWRVVLVDTGIFSLILSAAEAQGNVRLNVKSSLNLQSPKRWQTGAASVFIFI